MKRRGSTSDEHQEELSCPRRLATRRLALRYKVYQGRTLRGEARQAAREAVFDIDLLRSHQGIFDQATQPLCDYLVQNIGLTGLVFSDGFESGDTSSWVLTGNGS